MDTAILKWRIPAEKLSSYLDQARFRRSPGGGRLREVVADRLAHGAHESPLEDDMVALIRRVGLPEPVRQHEVVVRGRAVRFDLAYPDRPLAVELDGRGHLKLDVWQEDHDRHNATELAGWPSVRFTWTDVHERELYVAMTLGDALGLRPTRWKRL